MVREGRVLISVATDPDFGSNYLVTAYEVGAQVSAVYDGTGVPVYAGHGFGTGDKFIVVSEFPAMTKLRTVTSTTSTKLFCTPSVTVAQGDILVNLGADTETVAGTPDFTSPGLTVYTNMDYSTAATNNTVQADSNGRYRYFHKNLAIWELVRSAASTPTALYQEAGLNAVTGIDSSTDNAVVRWDGTTGEAIQNSVVTISDTGATTGITTLSASGISTLTGGIAGGKPYNIGTWVNTAASGAGSGTALTPSVTLVYVGSVFVPANATITGIQYLRGTAVAAAQKVIVALFNAAGTAVANSTTLGTTVGTASTAHAVSFTATYAAVGPAWYYVGLYFDTVTAALFNVIPAGCNAGNGVVGNGLASAFGTVATITPPTTFTQDRVPVASLF